MRLEGKALVLRIYIGSLDKHGHKPMYESIVEEAKKFGLHGATVYRGVMSYGANSILHSEKIWTISGDLPIIIEIVDDRELIEAFIDHLPDVYDHDCFGGIITIHEVDVLTYKAHKKSVDI